MKRIFVILCTIVLAGCSTDNGCSSKPQPKISQRSADYLALQYMAGQLNQIQTNWTVVIIQRTNTP